MTAAFPSWVHWEVTYACPLRCVHCYTESGRRPSRQIKLDSMLRIADKLIGMRSNGLRAVAISGGEPLIVDNLAEVLDRLLDGGLEVWLNTSGYGLTTEVAQRLSRLNSLRISIDGATPETNDRIRGRAGAFSTAVAALSMLDELSRARCEAGLTRVEFGIDATITRSNFEEAPRIVSDLAARFRMLRFVALGAVVPIGLASRESYEPELLSDEQMRLLLSAEYRRRLRSLALEGVDIQVTDGLGYALDPRRPPLPLLTIEPDGMVRGLIAFQGRVGNFFTDSPDELWRSTVELRKHPFITETLSGLKSSVDWARASRKIDQFFGASDDLVRIAKRKPYIAT